MATQQLRRKGYADIMYYFILGLFAFFSVFLLILGFRGYRMLGGIFTITIATIIFLGVGMFFVTFLVYNMGKKRGLGIPVGKCQVCGVESAFNRCTFCGRDFGYGCMPEGMTSMSSSVCIDCAKCAICDEEEARSRCLMCGLPMGGDCFHKGRQMCLECVAKRVREGKIKIRERRRVPPAKVIVLQPDADLSVEVCRQIKSAVRKELMGSEVVIGDKLSALGLELTVYAVNPATTKTKIMSGTKVNVSNTPKRDEHILACRETGQMPICVFCNDLAIKACWGCRKKICVRHQYICSKCGKPYCIECYDRENDICPRCKERLGVPQKAKV